MGPLDERTGFGFISHQVDRSTLSAWGLTTPDSLKLLSWTGHSKSFVCQNSLYGDYLWQGLYRVLVRGLLGFIWGVLTMAHMGPCYGPCWILVGSVLRAPSCIWYIVGMLCVAD